MESSCGAHFRFTYGHDAIALSGQSEDALQRDLRKFVIQSTSCTQAFQLFCRGTTWEAHCLGTHSDSGGSDKYGAQAFRLQNECRHNDYTDRKDDGVITDKHKLPITSWYYGDTGDGGEEAQLGLGELRCKA